VDSTATSEVAHVRPDCKGVDGRKGWGVGRVVKRGGKDHRAFWGVSMC